MFAPYKSYLRNFILALIMTGIISSCAIIDPETRIWDENEFYAINPTTILGDLAQGKTVFTPQTESPFEASPTLGPPVQWQEADYFRIAEALHELVWGEALQNWTLHKMFFSVDCAYLTQGIQDARIEYFKRSKTREQDSRWVSELIIEPRRNSVVGYKAEYYPWRTQWQAIDLSQIKVSAEDALQIAEKNGGSITRQTVANNCQISIFLFPDSSYAEYDGWNVLYSPNTGGSPLDVYYIDPVTGERKETK